MSLCHSLFYSYSKGSEWIGGPSYVHGDFNWKGHEIFFLKKKDKAKSKGDEAHSCPGNAGILFLCWKSRWR